MQKINKVELWNEILDSIKVSVSSAIFSTWLSKTHLVSLKKTNPKRYLAEIGCPSSFIQTTIERRYFGLIQDTLIKALSAPVDLKLTIKENPQEKRPSSTLETPLFVDQQESKEDLLEKLVAAHIHPSFTFESFAVSGSNQMAHAAALAVARQPGTAYNPLFLWGGVGVGKTHLMHAIAQNVIKSNSEAKIIACTSEEFTNDIILGIRNKTTQAFREKYRKVQALLIDDIQFIAGKDAVQDEFFHTFNAVKTAGGQIILTSDKPPTEIPKLEERLKSRFEAGLIIDISPPDFELRAAIVQIKAQQKGIDLIPQIIHLIAGNIDTARKIEGFLIKLSSEVKLKNLPLTEESVSSLITKGIKNEALVKKPISPDDLTTAVCTHFSISKRALSGKSRSKIIVRPRQILMYLLRTELKLPLEEVGRLLGGRDHSTIIHGVDKITTLNSTDVDIREDILRIKNIL